MRTMVKIKKGQSIILPGGAKIVSLTEVDGASADSLCVALPPPTPLKNYTFFIERELYRTGPLLNPGTELTIRAVKFVLGDNVANFADPGSGGAGLTLEGNLQQYGRALKDGIKQLNGVVALYVCSQNCADSYCNNTITVAVPESYPTPYFLISVKEDSADLWFAQLWPVDTNQVGQVERPDCDNRV